MALQLTQTDLVPIGEIDIPDIFFNRYKSGIEEVDHLLGNGALPGSVITLCAKGGLGKSTLMLQLFQQYNKRGYKVAYLSGEESVHQIAFKCAHLGVKDVPVANVTDLEDICELISHNKLNVVVIDSFQHITSKVELSGRQIQRVAINKLCKVAQETACTIFIIMHVTKQGVLKGDSYVPHTADVNMEIRSGEEEYGSKEYRIIEIPTKNRFGPPTEIVTKMTSSGYIFTVDVPEKQEQKESKRSNQKARDFKTILSMVEPPAITIQRVMGELDCDYMHAYNRLAELTRNGDLTKFGKGQNSIFKVTKVQSNDTSENKERSVARVCVPC
jgi:predicted ATP-dependent serine protease